MYTYGSSVTHLTHLRETEDHDGNLSTQAYVIHIEFVFQKWNNCNFLRRFAIHK